MIKGNDQNLLMIEDGNKTQNDTNDKSALTESMDLSKLDETQYLFDNSSDENPELTQMLSDIDKSMTRKEVKDNKKD